MSQFKLSKFFIVIFFCAACIFPICVNAAPTTILDASSQTTCNGSCGEDDLACKKYCGEYQVNDFLKLGVRITEMILGGCGASALLAMVIGGVMFLASAGNKTLVDRGKSTIIGAVIGLLVVFASYTIINFTAKLLGINTDTTDIFRTDWFKDK